MTSPLNSESTDTASPIRPQYHPVVGVGDMRLHSQSWVPIDDPRAHVVVTHGLGNHAGGYSTLAEPLVAEGFSVHAMDHRGHGRSDGPRIMVNRFADLIDDLRAFIANVRARAGSAPVFLFGHSWGGLLSLAYAIEWQDEIDGLVLCAAGVRPAAATPDQVAAVRVLARMAPDTPAISVNFDHLSRNPEAQQAFNDDPLVHRGPIPAGTAVETLDAIDDVTANLGALTLPILIMHGTEDTIADPAGSRMIYDHVASADRTLELYEGLWHQLFNEPEREVVLTDLADWINSHPAAPITCAKGQIT